MRAWKTSKIPSYASQVLANQLANTLVFLSILLVVATTLFPFNFFFQEVFEQLSISYVIENGTQASSLGDAVANILLFIPLGFTLNLLLGNRVSIFRATITVVIASFSLSLAVEILQLFIPLRNTTPLDILTNSTGGLVGCLSFQLGKTQVFRYSSALCRSINSCLSLKTLTLVFISYLTITFLLSISLQGAVALWNLSNWNSTYPLVLGNEQGGGRPWQGNISEICIANKSASEEEVAQLLATNCSGATIADSFVASYILTGKGSYPDQTGNLTDLVWQGGGGVPNQQQEIGVQLGSGHWLHTKNAAASLTEALRQTSQFTISTTVSTEATDQTGPARIISLSQDSLHRNFTLGQSGRHLSIRLRTPIIGENGDRPELVVTNVFADTNSHRLVLTYDGSLFKSYIDSLEHSQAIELTPEAALFWSLSPSFSSKIHINIINTYFYKLLYYAIIFLPLVILIRLVFMLF